MLVRVPLRVRTLHAAARSRAAWRALFQLSLLLTIFFAAPLNSQERPRWYVVQLRDPAVIPYLATLAGQSATAPSAPVPGRSQPGGRPERINPRLPRPGLLAAYRSEAAAYRATLRGRQAAAINRIRALTGVEPREQFDTVFNGVALQLTTEEIPAIQQLPEVAQVSESVLYHKVLDAALPLIQVPTAWSAPAIGGEDHAGAGVKIGMIDTGIDINHPMFQDPSLTPPFGFPRFTSATTSCPNTDQAFTNSKVIVARNYVYLLPSADPNCDAMDRDGHGTFTAGIAAGRRVAAPLASISGVAPKAFLGVYKVFGTPGINDHASLP